MTATAQAAPLAKIGGRRWVVVALLFLATVINYVDRQMLGVLKPIIQGRIHIPIGHGPGPSFAAPKSFTQPWNGSVDTIVSNRDGSMLH